MKDCKTSINIMAVTRKYPLSIVIAIAIWVVCMIPIPETPLNNISFMDKWTHFVMYGTLTAVIWVEYAKAHKGSFAWKRLLLYGFLCPIAMGCLVELAQAYLTTCRSGDVFDAICNALGVCLGAALGHIIAKMMPQGKKQKNP